MARPLILSESQPPPPVSLCRYLLIHALTVLPSDECEQIKALIKAEYAAEQANSPPLPLPPLEWWEISLPADIGPIMARILGT